MKDVFEHYLSGEYVYTQTMLPVCEKHSLTFTELTVIMFLFNNPSLDTASHIVKCRNIAKSHVSVSIRSLEEKGLISKSYRNGDRKSVHLLLTPLADPIIIDGKAAQTRFGEILFNGVSENEKSILSNILQKIDCNLKEYTNGGTAANAK